MQSPHTPNICPSLDSPRSEMQCPQQVGALSQTPSRLSPKAQCPKQFDPNPRVKFPQPICTSPLSTIVPYRLPSHNPPLPYRAHGTIPPSQQFLQGSLCRIFLRSVHILPIVPVASRDRKPRDGDVAGPGGALASTVGEDFVFWG